MKRNISVNALNNCAYSMCILVRFCIVKKRSWLRMGFFTNDVCNNYDYSNFNVFTYIEMNFDFEFYFNMSINIIRVIVNVRY